MSLDRASAPVYPTVATLLGQPPQPAPSSYTQVLLFENEIEQFKKK